MIDTPGQNTPIWLWRKKKLKSLKLMMVLFPEFHKRYIDDILGATSMSRENLDR